MAETLPTGEQIRFRSANTGDHVLDTYLESAEIGGRSLTDLLDDLFDPSNNGTFRANNFEFRFDPATDKLQFRVGQFASSTAGWSDLTTFFSIEGTFSTSTTYNNFDVVTLANKDVYIVHGLSSGTTFSSESNFISSANTEKLVDVSNAQDWASKVNGIVDSTDYSSKAYAIGGTGVDTTTGSAKDWATKTGSAVGNTSDFSAKHYATTGNVASVATNMSDINDVAGKLTEITLLGTSAVITDMGLLGTSANVTAMGHLGTSANVTAMGHLGTSTNVTAMGHLGTSANVTAMGVLGTSTVVTDMGLLGTTSNVANMATLGASGVTTNMATISNNISNVNTLATTLSGTQTFAVTVAGGVFVIDGANKPALTLVRGFTYTFDVSDGSNSGHPLQFKNGSSSYTTGVTVNGTAGQTGATVVFAVPSNAPATGLLYYCTVHGNSMGNSIATQNNDIASVVAISSDITSVANIDTDVTQVAGMNTNITNVLNNATNINTVANNITNVNSFANTYFISASAPTGGTVGAGDLWYDSSTNNLKIYNGSAWVTFIANYTTDNLTEGSTNQYYTNGRVEAYLDGGASTPVFASGSVAGAWNVNSLTGPATLVIDPAAIGDDTGTVQIRGSLQVDGTTTTVNSATLSVTDKNITVANGAANAGAANGAGLTVDGANATLTYVSASDTFAFNKNVTAAGATLTTADEATALAIALG